MDSKAPKITQLGMPYGAATPATQGHAPTSTRLSQPQRSHGGRAKTRHDSNLTTSTRR
ncbi:MAG: hypothetical protein ACYC5H_02800 [Methylovirgula sp.]